MIDKSTLNILVVDDEPFMLKVNCRLLANLGYTSFTACEGARQALELMDQVDRPPDVIMPDLSMPEMDGVEFLRHLVQRDFRGSVVLVSGEDERVLQAAERLVQAHQIISLGHLRKPVKQEMLGNLLRKWLPMTTSKSLSTQTSYTAAEISSAIRDGELTNYYQPLVSLSSGRVVGMETLVRWRHPLDGIVPPNQFIAIAEENGLIRDLTRVVIDHALTQASAWSVNSGLALHLAINVSMDDLGALDFADYMSGMTTMVGMLPQQVTLEVTESRLMQDQRIALDVLARLRLKRFRIAIDDFGTGHSSLGQLRDLPFDELKIDQSFVHGAWANETTRAIFNTSVMLANQLKMGIVAEGVEDRADWNFVCRSGCDTAQGYFIAKPMLAEAIYDWIADWDERVLELIPGLQQKN